MSLGDPGELSRFKFRWLDDNGNAAGMFAKKGSFDGETLVLDNVKLPVAAIAHVNTREQTMAITVFVEDGEAQSIGISISGKRCQSLKSSLDIARSVTWAEQNKELLQKEGRGHEVRAEQCPHCTATLILSGMPSTPQVYCHFCDTLSTIDQTYQAPPAEHLYKICDECGMFSLPRTYTIFYFYFIVVVYGISHRTTVRCPACMRGEAWKMLLGNFLFVLGIIPAIVQLVRSYGGSVSGPFAGLDRANIRARRGDVAGAIKTYEAIMDRVPCCAGIKYNVGAGLMQNEDYQHASLALELSLEDCTNYAPAYAALVRCYQQLGETEKKANLMRQWDDHEQEQQPSVE